MKKLFSIINIIVLILHFTLNIQSQDKVSLVIKDCQNGNLLDECLIFGKNGEYLGMTDSSGEIMIENNSGNQVSLRLMKMNYHDKVVNIHHDSVNIFCLDYFTQELDEITIKSKFNIRDYFESSINKAKDKLNPEKDTVYFMFTYSLDVDNTDWTEKMQGIISVPYKEYQDGWTKAYYTSYDYFINESLKTSKLYGILPHNLIKQHLNASRCLSYSKKIIKSLKDKNSHISMVKGESDDLVTFNLQPATRIEPKYYFVFNRVDTSLSKVTFFTPGNPFEIRDNELVYSYGEANYANGSWHSLEKFRKIEVFKNSDKKITIELTLDKLTDIDKLMIEKSKIPCEVRMRPNIETLRLCPNN
ncbi:MAG: hypothetical protein WBO36_02255 [Saprospiraceae bacterium]